MQHHDWFLIQAAEDKSNHLNRIKVNQVDLKGLKDLKGQLY